jgi:hypothetical protein
VIAEVADKLSKLIADTVIYTDAMKEEDKAQRSLNQRWVDSAARIKAIGREMQIMAEKTEAGKDALRLKFQLEDIGGSPDEIRAKITETQEKIKKAKEESTKTETHHSYNARGASLRVFTDSAIKAQATVKELDLNLSDLQRQLKEATAVAAQGAQVLANDLAAAAEKTAQDKKREQDALAAAADKAAKDKKKEQDELDAWVAHAVRSRGTLTEAVKRMAKEQAQADIDANLALAKSEEARIAKINGDEKAAAEEERQRQDEVYKGDIEVGKLASDKKIQLIEQDFERGKINRQQEIAAIAQEKERELEVEKLTQQKRWALWAGDVKKQQEIQNQINKIIAQSKLVETKAVTDGVKAQEALYKQVFSQIGSAITSNVMDVLKGTETIAQGFQKMYQSLLSSLLNYFATKAEKRAEDELLDLLGLAKKKIKNASEAQSSTATAAANTLADVPFPANIPAAASVQTIGEGYTIEAASSMGGDWQVDSDRLNFIHKNETILPAGIAGKLRNMVESGGPAAGITVVVNHSVNAVDASSFQGHIRRHSNMIANEVTRALKRKGAR